MDGEEGSQLPVAKTPGDLPRPVLALSAARAWRRYLAAIAIVAVSAGAAEYLYQMTASTKLSMIFLAGVLVSAVFLGSGPGYLAAGMAFLIYNFDLVDPRFTIAMGTPEDFITLIVFLAVAMMTGNLTSRIRAEAERAKGRAATTAVLFDATREFSASSDEEQIRGRLAHHLARACKGEALVREGLRMQSDPADAQIGRELILHLTAIGHSASRLGLTTERIAGWSVRPLHAGATTLGVAAWRTRERQALSSDELALLDLLADAGAAAISRARLAAEKADAEARARTEDLRNALLSSISHDMRTPLAAIMVSASSLRRYGAAFDDATRTDLAQTIEEETARLDAFVANLLNMTRLESGALVVQRVGFSVPEVNERTVARRNTAQRPVTVEAPAGLREGAGDPLLFEQALGNVVENAMRYTPAGRSIAVTVTPEANHILVQVTDQGGGVARQDLTRIFEKFFRSGDALHQPGTGLGLSIARGLLESMGGSIEAQNRRDGAQGLVVSIHLPAMA